MKIGKHYKIVFIWLFFLVFSYFSMISTVNAGSLWDLQRDTIGEDTSVPTAFGEKRSDVRDPREVILYIVKIFFTFLGIICVGFVLFAGYKWMTAQGDQNTIDEAKKIIFRAVIGLVIVMLSLIITSFAQNAIKDVVGEDIWLIP